MVKPALQDLYVQLWPAAALHSIFFGPQAHLREVGPQVNHWRASNGRMLAWRLTIGVLM